ARGFVVGESATNAFGQRESSANPSPKRSAGRWSSTRPVGEWAHETHRRGRVASTLPRSCGNKPDRREMADLKELADQAAEELLTAIRDQAQKASDLTLLQLAQAYSLVVST